MVQNHGCIDMFFDGVVQAIFSKVPTFVSFDLLFIPRVMRVKRIKQFVVDMCGWRCEHLHRRKLRNKLPMLFMLFAYRLQSVQTKMFVREAEAICRNCSCDAGYHTSCQSSRILCFCCSVKSPHTILLVHSPWFVGMAIVTTFCQCCKYRRRGFESCCFWPLTTMHAHVKITILQVEEPFSKWVTWIREHGFGEQGQHCP